MSNKEVDVNIIIKTQTIERIYVRIPNTPPKSYDYTIIYNNISI